MKAEDARNEALPKGDVAALEKIYADDVVYTNARGETLTKTAASGGTQGTQAQLSCRSSTTMLRSTSMEPPAS